MTCHRPKLMSRSAMTSLLPPLLRAALVVALVLGWGGLAAAQDEKFLDVEKWYVHWTVTIDGSRDRPRPQEGVPEDKERTHWVIEGGAVLDRRTLNDLPPGAKPDLDRGKLEEYLKTLPPQAREIVEKMPPKAQAELVRSMSKTPPWCASWLCEMDAQKLAPGDPRWDRAKVHMQESWSRAGWGASEGAPPCLNRGEGWASGTEEMGFHAGPPQLWVDAKAKTYWLSITPEPARTEATAGPWRRTDQWTRCGESETETKDLSYDVRWPESWKEGEGLLGARLLWTFVARAAPLAGAVGVLSGQRTYPATWSGGVEDGGMDGTVTITWTCSPRPLEPVELVVDVEGYDSWMPEGNLQDPYQQPGNSLTLRASLETKDGKGATKRRAEKIVFELVEVSQEPGVCLNRPPTWFENDNRRDNDLQFLVDRNPGPAATSPTGDYHSMTPTDGARASAVLSSFDFGGYALVRVSAVMEDGYVIRGHLRGDPQRYDIPLPKRRDGSYIAEKWLSRYGENRAFDPVDKDPSGEWPGDGLSAYEEYRGFVVLDRDGRSKHQRTDPGLKTLFVHTTVAWAERGLRLLECAAGIEVLRIDEPGYEDNLTRVVNFNEGAHHFVDQHGLWLVAAGLPPNRAAFAHGYFGPPRYVARVDVQKTYLAHPSTADPNMYRFAGIFRDLDFKIARELAYALGVPNHGDGADWWEDLQGTRSITARSHRYYVTCYESEHSGAQDCLMRYNFADYVRYSRLDGSIVINPYGPPEPWGTVLCDDDKGTGVNEAGQKCGDAARGSCINHVRVCDVYPQADW